MKEITLNIKNIIGDSFAVEAEDGQKVFERIVKAIDQDSNVRLSFLNIEMTTTAFLNSAVGQLYDRYAEERIRKHFKVADTSKADEISLKRVVETAKQYYSNSDALKKSIEDIMNE